MRNCTVEQKYILQAVCPVFCVLSDIVCLHFGARSYRDTFIESGQCLPDDLSK